MRGVTTPVKGRAKEAVSVQRVAQAKTAKDCTSKSDDAGVIHAPAVTERRSCWASLVLHALITHNAHPLREENSPIGIVSCNQLHKLWCSTMTSAVLTLVIFGLLKALPGGNSLRNKAVVNVAPATNAMSLDAPRCCWMSWMSAKEKARSDAGLKYCLDFSGC